MKRVLYPVAGSIGGILGMTASVVRKEGVSACIVGFLLAFVLTVIMVDHYYNSWREHRRR